MEVMYGRPAWVSSAGAPPLYPASALWIAWMLALLSVYICTLAVMGIALMALLMAASSAMKLSLSSICLISVRPRTPGDSFSAHRTETIGQD